MILSGDPSQGTREWPVVVTVVRESVLFASVQLRLRLLTSSAPTLRLPGLKVLGRQLCSVRVLWFGRRTCRLRLSPSLPTNRW